MQFIPSALEGLQLAPPDDYKPQTYSHRRRVRKLAAWQKWSVLSCSPLLTAIICLALVAATAAGPYIGGTVGETLVFVGPLFQELVIVGIIAVHVLIVLLAYIGKLAMIAYYRSVTMTRRERRSGVKTPHRDPLRPL